jgi:subtilisin family serine protease
MNFKKIFTGLVSVAMLASTLTCMPTAVFADETTSRTYTYDGYEITYDVTNSWGDTEAISVTLTNTSDETIENWMLVYDDFNGEISGIWDAEVESTNSGYEYIRNSGYNANIAPNQTISFGYNLDDSVGKPDVIVMAQDRLEKSTSAYDVALNIVNEWDTTFQGEIIINNNTDKPIEWWKLTFDSNFTITEVTTSWAASVIDNSDGNYTFEGTYTGIIEANSSVTLGFQAIKNGTPEISDISLNDVVYNGIEADNEYNLEDIGEAYFKDIESIYDIDIDENGIEYVKNQFLLTAYNDVPYDTIEALGEEYDAEIVGYIELTNDYQFEVTYDVTSLDIYDIIDELSENQYVEYASINSVIEYESNLAPNDPWNPDETIDWDASYPAGSNWGVEAIDALGAWEYLDQMSEVKIGLIDSMFDTEHDDLSFFNIWHNPSEIDNSHGTHVAGTMAAEFDNNLGLSGIAAKNKLYGYSTSGQRKDPILKKIGNIMEIKYSTTLLVGNDVKVINYSMGFDRSDISKREGLENYIDSITPAVEQHLSKLIAMGYDFVIVCSAGNDSIDSTHNSLFTNASNPVVKNRIIVVGSIGKNGYTSTYHFSTTFSNTGERVDVVAPGENIYSAVYPNSYEWVNWTGTSMATPHVSGTAGLLYSVNPNLSGEQVKQIIIDTAGGSGRTVNDTTGRTYNIVNAKAAVELALNTEGENAPTNDAVVYVRDYVTGRQVNNATIRIQGRDPQNQDVDMYLTDGVKANIITGWYNMTISANGYVTYRFNAYHSSEGFTIINLVEDSTSSNGTLQITAKDWINNAISNTEFNLYTINENFEKVLVNTGGTYLTTNGMTDNVSLAPGYYLAEATTGFTQYTQELYPVAANHTTNETYLRFGIEGVVETYGFEVNVDGNEPLNINFQLAARASDESLRLDEYIIATNVHPNNYDGVYFHFFDTEAVRANKIFSIGFKLTRDEYNRIVAMEDPDALSISVMISHGLHGTPSTQTIWVTGTDILNAYDSASEFFEFATIAYDSTTEEYAVSSNYWLVDSDD